MSGNHFFRVRIMLLVTCDTTLPTCHAGVLYALASAAWGKAARSASAMPEGFMLDAPEQGRRFLMAGQCYALGFAVLDRDGGAAAQRLAALIQGLSSLGAQRPAPAGLRGNFAVARIEDLVAGHAVQPGEPLQAVPRPHILAECEQARTRRRLTLRFLSPLRLERPGAQCRAAHRFFDGEYFDPAVFLHRLQKRLDRLDAGAPPSTHGLAEALENRLVWLDFGWGRGPRRKTLGGAVGRVSLAVEAPSAADALVWGQYARCGKNTRFGFGAYRIKELGDDPFACRRAVGMAELAFCLPALGRAAESSSLSGSEVVAAAQRALSPGYAPDPPTRIPLNCGDGLPRELAVPSRADRVLQCAALGAVAPAVDGLLSHSSIAWRRGLGRRRAPGMVERAWREGFRFALKEDFARFFDSVDHRRLQDRIVAYLGDDSLCRLILNWVASGAAGAGNGLPVGAPLSPLLANIFLDEFDERIRAEGARLVRYGDEFLVLFRSLEQAAPLARAAAQAAERLRLRLNEKKSALLDLHAPFEFLGYRFERQLEWRISQTNAVRLMDDAT